MTERLPLLLSVPHGGLWVPPEVAELCLLDERQLERDGDEGAPEIYALDAEVTALVRAEVARAIVDLNRAPDDLRPDGVVKTQTCFEEPVYAKPLSVEQTAQLLERHYHPYHERLRELAPSVRMGVDCHTMLAEGPPIGPGAGERRPRICLSNADGTCPQEWFEALGRALEAEFGEVGLNDPFRGGHLIRRHAAELPWVQLEISREPFASRGEKRQKVLAALRAFCNAELS